MLALLVGSATTIAQAALVINEVRYNVSPQGGNQYVELVNNGATNEYLDGKILTDEAGLGSEGVFQFPGAPGETNHPLAPGAYVLIAVDATNATQAADWECYAGVTDSDNPSVPNLVLIAGNAELGLATTGDNILLADGTDVTVPIDTATVIDGVNFAGGGGELAPLSSAIADSNPSISSTTNTSISRCPDGVDNNVSSASDFIASTPTPGAANNCTQPSISLAATSGAEGDSGSTPLAFAFTLSATSDLPVTVQFATSNGTATAGFDYVATNGTVTFSPGITSFTVNVMILGDTTNEVDETFTLRLANSTNATLSTLSATGTILDDDADPYVVVTSVFTRITFTNNAIATTWTATNGSIYQLQSAYSPASTSWMDIGSAVTAASDTVSITDTNAATTSRVYRVLLLYW